MERVKKKSEVGRTPLHHGMRHTASTEVIKLLLEVCLEEDVKEKEKWDMTPLHLGLMNKAPAEEIKLVVDAYAADVKAKTRLGNTPLYGRVLLTS
jgi:hypothetical protein